jgi:GNAT superfamily N-acetyltransferase
LPDVAELLAAYERFEWKLRGHDRPADLPQRLRAARFVPEEEEAIVIVPTTEIAGRPQLPEGVCLRNAIGRCDLDRIAALEQTVWGEDHGWLAESLDAEREADPDAVEIVVAETGGTVVCAGSVRFERGTEFATLWGDATLPDWRGRGIYRATIVHRANLAAQRRFRFIEVDASSASRPILERLGLTAVTTTTPYVWAPPSPSAVEP